MPKFIVQHKMLKGAEETQTWRAQAAPQIAGANQAGQQIVQRQLQVAPTLTIRPGFPVRIIVTRDLVFEPAGG